MPSSNATLRKKYREVAEYRQKRLAFSRAYRAANKEEINRKRRIKNANPKVRAAMRDARLKRMYGISHDDYEAMYKRQRGRCRICGVKKRTLFIDHKETDHKGKIVRGLLCHPCNVGLGFFRDDTKRMRRAIDYVKASAEAAPAPQAQEGAPAALILLNEANHAHVAAALDTPMLATLLGLQPICPRSVRWRRARALHHLSGRPR